MMRWKDEKWDEQMKSEMNRCKKKFSVWTYVKPNLVLSQIPFTMVGPPQKNLLRMVWNMSLFRNFWDLINFFWGGVGGGGSEVKKQASIPTYRHDSDQIKLLHSTSRRD